MEEDNFVPESLSRTYFWPHIRHQALKFEISKINYTVTAHP